MDDERISDAGVLRVDRPASGNTGGSPWRLDGIGLRSFSQARPWVLATILVAGFTIWGYVYIGPSGRLEPGHIEQHKTDFTVFTEAGAAFFDGRNPYRVANPRGWHYLYPPLFALLVAPLSIFDTESQVVFWYAINVALAFGCIGEARRLWRLGSGSLTRTIQRFAGCAVLAVMLPFFDCMQAGQLGIAIVYLLMLGCRMVIEGKSRAIWFLGGITLSLPASVKLVPTLPVVFLLFQQWLTVIFPERGRRSWGRAICSTGGVSAGGVLFLLLIPGSILGWQKNLHYLDVWQKQVVNNERIGPQANFNIHSYRNQSLANAAYLASTAARRSFAADAAALPTADRPERIAQPMVRVAIGLIVLVLAGVVAMVGRGGNGLDAFTAFGLACSAMLLVSPLSWGHYFMAELPALICVPIWLWRRGMPFAARVVAALPVVLSWSYYMAMPYTGGLGVLGLGTAAWFVLACGFIVWAEAFGADAGRSGRLLEKNGLVVRLHSNSVIRGPFSGVRSHQPAAGCARGHVPR